MIFRSLLKRFTASRRYSRSASTVTPLIDNNVHASNLHTNAKQSSLINVRPRKTIERTSSVRLFALSLSIRCLRFLVDGVFTNTALLFEVLFFRNGVSVTESHYGDRPGEVMDIIKPSDSTAPHADACVYVHGGGFICGRNSFTRPYFYFLCRKHNKIIYVIDYPKSPKYRFPIQILSVSKALRQLKSKHDVSSIHFFGDSAGGSLVAFFSLLLFNDSMSQTFNATAVNLKREEYIVASDYPVVKTVGLFYPLLSYESLIDYHSHTNSVNDEGETKTSINPATATKASSSSPSIFWSLFYNIYDRGVHFAGYMINSSYVNNTYEVDVVNKYNNDDVYFPHSSPFYGNVFPMDFVEYFRPTPSRPHDDDDDTTSQTNDVENTERLASAGAKSFPPMFLIVGNLDPLYEENIKFVKKYQSFGLDIEHHVYENETHAFFSMPTRRIRYDVQTKFAEFLTKNES